MNHHQERELHIRDYLRILARRKWPAIAVFVVAAAVTVIRVLMTTPVYRATTRLMIERTEVQNMAMVNPLYSSWDPDFYNTQVQVIRSSATAERAARALVADETFRAKYGAPAGAGAPGAAAPPPSPALVRMIRGGVDVAPVKDTKIVVVGYRSPEPALAALVVNAVVKAYIEQLFEMKMSYSRSAIEWMTEKAREEGRRLEESERALQAFVRANDFVTVQNRVAGIPESVSELGLELTKAETRRRELETVNERFRALAGSPAEAEAIPVVQADPGFQAVKAQLLKAEQSVLDLAKKYGQKHPAMIAAREEVAALHAKKTAEVTRVAGGVRSEYELARSREEDLRRRLAAGRGEALAAGEKLVRYEELKRAVETNRQFYDTLMARAKEESLTQQLQGVQVWTLEPAEPPQAPDGPRATRTLVLGLLVGLVAAVGAAFFAEYLDTTVHSPDDLELKSGVPVLGVIPVARGRGRHIERVVSREPRQATAESYKALRTAILLSSETGPPPTILVTSTAPEEGKTATAVNLAAAIAQSGYSVLLVDADLRRPRVHGIFDLPNDHGLSSVLQGADPEPLPSPVDVPNLSVLTAGPVPANPSELLGSKRMDAVIALLRGRYDIILFDSPPVLTVADGLVLGRKLGTVIFVCRAERSTYDGVRRGVRALTDIGARPLGLVLNAYDQKRSGEYSYYYGYGEESEPGKRPRRSAREKT